MPLPPELLALLKAAQADPQDDSARLVLADWLEENGQTERAAFIRLQLKADRLPKDAAEREEWEREARALEEQHGKGWLGSLVEAPAGVSVYFVRGLVSVWIHWPRPPAEVAVLDTWLHGNFRQDELAWWELRLRLEKEVVPVLLPSPILQQIGSLSFRYNWGTGALIDLLRKADHLSNLVYLDLGNNQLTTKGVKVLSNASSLSTLRTLDLSSNQGGPELAEALTEATYFTHLANLDLNDNRLADAGAKAFCRATQLGSLTVLNLSNNEIGCAGATALSEASHLGRLFSLALFNNRIGAAGALALSKATHWTRLSALNLSSNQLGDAGAAALSKAAHLSSLTSLNLSANQIGDIGGEALARSPHFPKLRDLDLSSNRLGPRARFALCRRFPKGLRLEPQSEPSIRSFSVNRVNPRRDRVLTAVSWSSTCMATAGRPWGPIMIG
jgi:uncharacterized protein (TIGR02996 family)